MTAGKFVLAALLLESMTRVVIYGKKREVSAMESSDFNRGLGWVISKCRSVIVAEQLVRGD